jgi:hypothetical protein
MLPQSVKADIEALLQKAANENLVSSCKAAMKILTEYGLVYECKVHSKYVGVHESNRDGFGVSGNAVANLASQIFHLGFDYSEVRAVAVEIDDASRDSCTKFNRKMCEGSSGTLAPVDVALKFASLQGSHTNQVLRCIHYGVKHFDEAMTEAGCLSVSKISLRDRLFAEAVKEGLVWTIISTEAVRLFPTLPALIQASGNAAGQVAQGEHEIQTMRKVLNAWYAEKALLPEGHLVDFAKVRSRTLASANAHGDAIPWMYAFLLKYCGGSNAEFLKHTENYVRQHCSMNVKLGSGVYQALSADCKAITSPLINLRHAIIKLAYSSNSVSKAEVTKLLNATDKELLGKICLSEQLMIDCRQRLSQSNGPVGLDDLFHRMSIDMVKLLLGKKTMTKRYERLESIAHDFVADMASSLGTSVDSPYKDHAVVAEPIKEPSSNSGASKHTHLDMTEMTADGRVANGSKMLLAAGFTVGCNVKRSDGAAAILAEVTDDRVKLKTAHDVVCSMDITSFLKEAWSVFTPKSGPEVVDASKLNVKDCLEYSAAVMKARILLELDALTQKHQKCVDRIKVFNKPKNVQVVDHIAKGQLVLVPTTTRILHKPGDLSSRVADVVYVGNVKNDVQFWLMAPAGAENSFVAGFWHVQFTSEIDKANMEMFDVKTSIDKLTIPALRNSVKVSPGDALLVYKRFEKKQKFKELGSDVPASTASLSDPKKKAKRSCA